MRQKTRSGSKGKAGAAEHLKKAAVKVAPAIALLMLIAALAVFEMLGPAITGFVVAEKSFTTAINKEITATAAALEKTVAEIPIALEAAPNSFSLSGKLVGQGTAKAYLQINGQRYLILDTAQLKAKEAASSEGLLAITGRIVEEIQEQAQTITAAVTGILAADNTTAAAENNATANETSTNQTTVNETQQPAPEQSQQQPQVNKTVTALLQYNSGTAFDANDDGVETTKGAIDYTVAGTQFNWAVDESKLCTRWKIDSAETATTTVICNGNGNCCALVQLQPKAESWNEPFQLFYGAFDDAVGYSNNVSAQAIYAYYSLETAEATVDVAYSDWQTLPAKFLPIMEFKAECAETCILPKLELNGSYNAVIIVELEDAEAATTLTLDSASYTALVAENATPVYKPPQLLKQIENITIAKNSVATIKLNDYFADAGNEQLSYDYYGADNITIAVDNAAATAMITPDKGFTGKRYSYFTAVDSENLSAVSNIFTITVAEAAAAEKEETQEVLGRIEINKPVKWRKVIRLAEESSTTTEIPAAATAISVRENGTIDLEERVKVETKDKAGRKVKTLRQHLKEKEQEPGSAAITTAAEAATENITLIIEERATEVEVEYETPAPTAVETEISGSTKQITISSDVHYENVTAYTNVTESPAEAVKLYWLKKVKKQKTQASEETKLAASEPKEAATEETIKQLKKLLNSAGSRTEEPSSDVSLAADAYANSFSTSDVDRTLTLPCFLNAFSSDQIGQLLASASAKYGSSFVPSPCGEIVFASPIKPTYLPLVAVLTDFSSRERSDENSASVMPAKLLIFSLSDASSLNAYSGEINSQPKSSNASIVCLLAESALKNENRTLASTMSVSGSILNQLAHSPCRLATLSLNPAANLSACLSVSLDFDSISSAIENSSLLTNCATTLPSADSNLPFSSGAISTLTTTSATPSSPKLSLEAAYLKVSETLDFAAAATENEEAEEAEETFERVLVEGVAKIDTDGDGLIDRLEWTIPSLSNQTYEVEIIILNPYTYLRNEETWTVAFNTTGTADLIINSTNAFWQEIPVNNPETADEMQFINLSCGNSLMQNELVIRSDSSDYNYSELTQQQQQQSIKPYQFIVKDYSCNETGYFSNFMEKAGYAALMFSFGSQAAFAYDPTAPSAVPRIITDANSSTVNVTSAFASSQLFGYANFTDAELDPEENSTFKWFTNNTNQSQGGNRTAEFVPMIYKDAVLYMHLDENGGGTGNYSDSSGNDNDGQPFGGVVNKTGIIKGAASFDGVNDVVNITGSTSLNLNTSFTVMAWAKVAATETIGGIVSWGENDIGKRRSMIAWQKAGDSITRLTYSGYGEAQGANMLTQSKINDDQWHHLAVTVNASGYIKAYVDGTLENESGNRLLNPFTYSFTNIGTTQVPEYLDGSIDEVAIYNRTLNASEIKQLYLRTWYDYSPQLFLLQPYKDNSTGLNSSDNEAPLAVVNAKNVSGAWAGTQGVNITQGFINYSNNRSQNFNEREGTIEFWIQPTWAGNDNIAHTIFNTETTTSLNITKSSGNDLSVYTGNPVLSFVKKDVSGWTSGNWQHVAVIWNNYTASTILLNISLFINGTLANNSGTAFTIPVAKSFLIGAANGGIRDFCNCTISEFRISRKALTAQEINLSFSKGRQYFQNEFMLNGSNYVKGDAFKLEYTPSDRNDQAGSPVNSSIITIVVNTPPSIPRIEFPTEGLNTDLNHLNVSNLSDTDGDQITLYWYVNAVFNQTSSGNTTLSASDGTYSVNASAFDGTDWSANSTTVTYTLGSVNACRTLAVSGKSYTMTASVASEGTCFNITATGITLDCGGYTIDYANLTSGYGINITGYNSTTVRNCIITQSNFSVVNAPAIFALRSNNSIFSNNSINTTGNLSYGIELQRSNYTNISGNIINTTANFSYAISMLTSSWNNATSNTIRTRGATAYGINVTTSNNNLIQSNTIITSGTSVNNIGIYFSGSSSGTANTNTINTSGTGSSNNIGIYFSSSSNSGTANNNTINTSGTSNNIGIYYSSSSSGTANNNTIRTSGTSTGNVGIYFDSSSSSGTANTNTIRTSGTSTNYGIYFSSSSSSGTANTNTISTSGTSTNYGIYFSSSNTGTATSNTINTSGTSTDNDGIVFSSSSSGTANNNNINTSGTGANNYNNYGIYFTSSNSGTATGNNITTRGTFTDFGIYFSNSNSGTANNNIMTLIETSGWSAGIWISGSSSGTVTNNTINTSGTSENYGIYISGESDKNNVSGNFINTTATSAGGIFVGDSGANDPDFNNLTNNVILTRGTTAHGIYVATDAENTIVRGNVINTTSTGQGIRVESNTLNNITGNNVTTSANNAFGIYVLNAINSNYTGNIVKTAGAGSFAVQIDNTTTSLSVNNTFTNNIFNTTARHVNITHPSSDYFNNFSLSAITAGTNIVGGSNLGGNFYDNSTSGGQAAWSLNCTNDGRGICDTSLTHAASNVDFFPLTLPVECGSLSTASKTYAMSKALSAAGTCFTVAADSVTLDCNGYSVTYATTSAGYGVNITGFNSTVVKNCNFLQQNSTVMNSTAIFALRSNNSIFSNNSINTTGNYSYGIELQSSNLTNISSNVINTTANFSYGVSLLTSSWNNVTSNTIRTRGTSAYGVNLTASSSNSLISNTINTTGSTGYGIYFGTVSNDNLILSNTVTTTGVIAGIYLRSGNRNNVTGNTVAIKGGVGSAYGIDVPSSLNNITGNNASVTGQGYGISISGSSNKVTGNNLTDSGSFGGGLLVSSGSSNEISRNTNEHSGTAYGFDIINSNYNNITGNNISGFSAMRIFQDSNFNLVDSNNISSSGTGIFLEDNGASDPDFNNLTNNVITTSASAGIYLETDAENNLVKGNVISTTSTGEGIRVESNVNNNITRNNITTSANNAFGIYLLNARNSNYTDNIVKTTGTRSFGVQVDNTTTGLSVNNTFTNNIFNTTARHVNITHPSSNYRNNFSLSAITSGTNVVGGSNLGGNFYDNSTSGGRAAYSLTCMDSGGDGICDTSLTHATNNVDFYPLTVSSVHNSIVAPLAGANVSGSFLVNASVNASVSGGAVKVNLTIYNSTGNATGLIPMSLGAGTANAGYWNVTFDSTTLRDAAYNLSVNATDNSGNINISLNVSVVVDNTKANVSIVAPANDSTQNGNMLINASVNDSLSKVFNVTFRLANASNGSVSQWLFATLGSGTISQGYWNATFDTSTVADGTYNATINATDFAGNQQLLNISQFTIQGDNTAPNVSIIVPSANSNLSGSFLVNASVNDTTSAVVNVNLTIYNSTGNATGMVPMNLSSGSLTSGHWNVTFDSTTLPDGFYNLSVNATDSAATPNTNISANVSITIDNTFPAPSYGLGSDADGAAFARTYLNFNITVNELHGATMNVSVVNGSFNVVQSINVTYNTTPGFNNITFTGLSNGTYNISIAVADRLGHVNLSAANRTVKIDTTLPTISWVRPEANTLTYHGTSTPKVNASCFDNNLFRCNLTLYFAGNLTVRYSNLSDNIDVTRYWHNLSLPSLDEGRYILEINATDDLTFSPPIPNLKLIQEKLQMTLSDATTGLNYTVTPLAFIRGTEINLSAINFNRTTRLRGNSFKTDYDINLTKLPPILKLILSEARLILRVQSNQPIIIRNRTNGHILLGTQYYYHAQDIKNLGFNITTNATNSTSVDIIITQGTASWLSIFKLDPVTGGLNVYGERSENMTVDLTAPNATTLSPANNGNASGTITVRAGANDSLSGITSTNFQFRNSTNQTSVETTSLNTGTIYAGEWAASYNTAQLADGRYNITFNATDFSGNSNLTDLHENFTVTIDNTVANATIVAPANLSNFSATFTINASVNDSLSKVLNVTFKLYNNTGNATGWIFATLGTGNTGQGYWNATVNPSALPEGRHNITINATDFAGNQLVINSSTVVIDRTGANATIAAPLNGTTQSSTITINASANDSLSKVFNVTFKLYNSTGNATGWIFATLGTGNTGQGYWNATLDTTTVTDAAYNITVNATDYAGNQQVINISQITIDNVAEASPPASEAGGGQSKKEAAKEEVVEKVKEEVKEEEAIGLKVDISSIVKELVEGESTTFSITVASTMNETADVTAKVSGKAAGFIIVGNKFKVDKKKTMEIPVFAFVPDGTPEGAYDAILTLATDKQRIEILIIINVKKSEAYEKLFDLKVEPQSAVVYGGQGLRVDIYLVNLGEAEGSFDVELKLELIRIDTNETAYQALETLAVGTKLKVSREIKLEEALEPGNYLVKALIRYINRGETLQAVSFAQITVKEKKPGILNADLIKKFALPLSILILIFLAMITYYKGTEIGRVFGEIRRYGQREFVRLRRREIPLERRRPIERRKAAAEKRKAYARHEERAGLTEREKLSRKVQKWRASGYNTTLLEKELQELEVRKPKAGKIEINELAKKILKWKAQGYNTTLLEKELQALQKNKR